MSPTVYLALFGWIPLTLLLFSVFPPRRATLVSLVGGWLFLPVAAFPISGLPDFSKISSISLGTLFSVLIFDGRTALAFRPRWFDVPMVAWCIWPLVSSVVVGLGPYAGAAAALNQAIGWGVPYLLGRVYFADRAALGELLRAICAAGLIYAPLCLYEIRMSPNLHSTIYGFTQHQFVQTMRMGGWRPMVFLQHGLALAMFMVTATLAAVGIWTGRARKSIFLLPPAVCVAVLLSTTVLCKSAGSLVLLLAGAGILLLTRRGRRSWLVLALLVAAPVFLLGRGTGLIPTASLVSIAEEFFSEDQVASFRVRLDTEDEILEMVKMRPIAGWGPWGAYRVTAAGDALVKASDGFWIIILGKYGVVGLALVLLSLLLPPIRAMYLWGGRDVPCAATLALSVILALYAIDLHLNAMLNPLFPLIAGAVASTGGAYMRPASQGGGRAGSNLANHPSW